MVGVRRLFGRSNRVGTGEKEGEREAPRPKTSLGLGENAAVRPFGVVPQLQFDVRLVLLCPSSQAPRIRPGPDQIGQIQGATGEGPGVLPVDLLEKRGRVIHSVPIRENLDLRSIHRKHDDRPNGLSTWRIVLMVGIGVRRGMFAPERAHEHFIGRQGRNFACPCGRR